MTIPSSQVDRKTSFDFLKVMDDKYNTNALLRLEMRKKYIVEANLADIIGKRVLDLASHDGRWPLTFAYAGAASVVGVEARAHLVEAFGRCPDREIMSKVRLHHDDLFAFLEAQVAAGEQYDTVAVLGIFYHVMEHYRLLKLVKRLKPNLIIVDSEFLDANWPYIRLGAENPEGELNSTAHDGEEKVPIGIPSTKAMELMAQSLRYGVEWADWSTLPEEERKPVSDYYRETVKRRMTCMLRPL